MKKSDCDDVPLSSTGLSDSSCDLDFEFSKKLINTDDGRRLFPKLFMAICVLGLKTKVNQTTATRKYCKNKEHKTVASPCFLFLNSFFKKTKASQIKLLMVESEKEMHSEVFKSDRVDSNAIRTF